MSNSAENSDLEPQETTADQKIYNEIKDLSEEQQVDLLFASLTEFLDKLESQGLEPAVTHCVLISTMATRMAQQDCREEFEHYLTEALEEEWPVVNYH
jgi:hypothetical protein